MSSFATYFAIFLIILYLCKYVQSWLVRIRLGLPGPLPPLPYIGEALFLLRIGKKRHEHQFNLVKKYGPILATTEFGNVRIFITDPEIIKEVCVKKFDHFNDVPPPPAIDTTKHPYKNMISLSGPTRWRRIRNTISPFFTAAMMKNFVIPMNQAMATLIKKLNESSDRNDIVDPYVYVKKAAVEVAVKTSFSLDAKSQTDDDDPFYKNAEKAMTTTVLTQLIINLPFVSKMISWLVDPYNNDYLVDITRRVVKERRQSGVIRKDFIQLLLDTENSEDSDRRLSEEEIVAQSFVFMKTGHDGIASTVAYTLYHLALQPAIQQKVCDEIESVWQDYDGADASTHEVLQKLSYLDMVLQESLRLFPSGFNFMRRCIEDCEIKGIQFKKGMFAVFPTYLIHRLPEIWSEPEKFIPERFTSEEKAKRDVCHFLPFGFGPRICVGRRFASMRIKLVLVNILKNFVIEKTEKTLDSIEFETEDYQSLTMVPGSIILRFKSR